MTPHFLLLAVSVLASGQAPQTVSVPIQNASFEEPLAPGGSPGWVPVPGWNASVLQYGGGVHVSPDSTAPDGADVVVILHGQISQDLGIRPKYGQNGTYLLTFYVANWFYPYPGFFSATLSIGSVPLCSASGLAKGEWQEIPLTCPFSNYISVDRQMPNIGFTPADFFVSLSNPAGEYGWQVKFDEVSLSFTPSQ